MRICERIKRLLCGNQYQAIPPKENVVADPDPTALQLSNALTFGRMSFELEQQRGDSLITHSGHMLTAFSLYSAALLMLLSDVINLGVPAKLIWISAAFVFGPLIVGLFLNILSQWRYKYDTLTTADKYRKDFSSAYHENGFYAKQSHFDYQLIRQITKVQNSQKDRNDKRLHLIVASMVAFLVSLVFLVLVCVVFAIFY